VKPVLMVVLVDAMGWRLAGQDPAFAPLLEQRRPLGTILVSARARCPPRSPAAPARAWPLAHVSAVAAGEGVFHGFWRVRLLPPRLRQSWKLTGLLTRLVERRGVQGYFNLYDVPRDELPAFDLPERGDIFAPGGLPWTRCGIPSSAGACRGVAGTGGTPKRSARVRRRSSASSAGARTSCSSTAPCSMRSCTSRDRTARASGSPSTAWSAWFGRAREAAARAGREAWLYLCSDHGMVDVDETVDVMRRVDALPFRRGRDFLAFYDSTFARFWWRSPAARDAVRAALAAEPAGRWLEPAELQREGADFADQRYGEDLFLLRPGALLVPSFMGRTPGGGDARL
jgi:hypothetical protein